MPPCCPSCIHQSLEPARDHRGKVVDPRPAMYCNHKEIMTWIGFRFADKNDPDIGIETARAVSRGAAMCIKYQPKPMQMGLKSFGVMA